MLKDDSQLLNNAELYQALNLETGKLEWDELQRHFARGVVIAVDNTLDLVEVAREFVSDNKQYVENGIKNGTLCRAHDDHGRHWEQQKPSFWAIVVAPWVLVQEISVQ